jgi:regulation of enolase protein 1 (concanavalin A-like superfamily)
MGISGPQYFDGNKIVDDDEWHFISGVYDGTLAIIYVDGEIDATANFTGQIGATTDNFFIGENSQARNRYFKGLLDDVRLYNRAMTQDEVKGLMKGDVTRSSNPKPANGATVDVEKALPLTWTTGEKAAQHDVYVGTNALDVESADISDTTGIYKGRQDPNTFSPPEGVKSGQTYYWRIDEVNTDGTISVGRVWSFTVANYIIVDDFEQYNNTDNQIYNTWSDYYVNNTGMTGGHFEPPFAEQDIVHGGAQSIYMRYDNDGTVNEGTDYEKSGTSFYSEAERTWADAQDWTRKGITSLTLWFRGIQGSIGSFTLGPPIKITGIGTDIAGTADQCCFSYKKLSGNGSITAKVLSITNTDSLAKAGVMMRESLDAGSKHFTTVACPGNRVMFVRRTTMNGAATSTSRSGVNIPVWVRLTRSGNTFTSQYSTNGTTWTTVGTPQEIQMPVDVYVGLCVTSRNATTICTAEFSDVGITGTGTVTGDWKSQDIGLKINAPEQLYVALQDSVNNSAVVRHPNPASTTITTWTQWDIPMSAFTSVNLQSITKLSIGVGDRTSTQPGGAGDLYIDDIGLKLP